MEQKGRNMYHKEKSAKQLIADAYLRLLNQKPYLDITVTDVVKEAQVARVSYYRAFDSLDGVLEFVLDGFYEKVTKDILPMFMRDKLDAWKTLLLKAYRSIKEDGFNVSHVMHQNSAYMLACLTRRFDFDKTFLDSMTLEQKYMMPVNISAMFTCAKIWADSGYKETPEQLAEFVFGIIKRNLSEQ